MEISGRALKSALSVLGSIGESENIKVFGNGRFAATDQLRSAAVIADAIGEGNVVLNREMLWLKALACSHDQTVRLFQNDAALNVSQGSGRWKLPIAADQSFHDDLVSEIEGHGISISASFFLTALERVSPACAADGRNLALCGVLVDFQSGYLVAADGILFFWEDFVQGDIEPFIIPAECVGPIHKIFKDCGELEIKRSDNWFSISGGDATYRAKMIDAKYPDWQKVLPQSIETVASAKTYEFSDALRLCASISTKKGSGASSGRVLVDGNGRIATLKTSNSHGEEGESSFAMKSDNPVSRAMAHKRLLTALNTIDWPEVSMEFHSSTGTPLVLKDPRGGRSGRMVVAMYG